MPELYGMFQNTAAFAAAVDRLDVLCGGTGPRNRLAQVRAKASDALDEETRVRLENFIAEQVDNARRTFKDELCGIELSEDRKTYAEVFQEHSRRLEAALALRAQ